MADYEFKFRLQSAPTATYNGSGVVQHDIWVISRVEGSSDEWAIVSNRHKTISIPAAEVQAALADGSPVAAYKGALVANIATQPVPVLGWDQASLESLMDGNDAAADAAAAINEFITVTNGWTYPLDFSL